MKTRIQLQKILLMFVMFFSFTTLKTYAQDQMLYIHQDWIKPSKSENYKTLTKQMVEEFTKHDFPYAMNTLYLSDGSVISVSPVKNYAEFDSNPYKDISEKMGAEKWKKLHKDYAECYYSHNSFLVTHKADLSYTPKGESMEGYDYNEYHFYQFAPGDDQKIADQITAIKDIFVKKGATMNFSIYRSEFGTAADYYVAQISAKDEAHLKEMYDNTIKLIGDDGKKTLKDLYESSYKYEMLLGWYSPELSYSPKK